MGHYDDTQLQRMFAELEPRRRMQAMRGAFRKGANAVRKAAVGNLRQSGLRSDRDLEKGIRRIVYKQKAGFRVTVGTRIRMAKVFRENAEFHRNRRGKLKPVLMWAEGGTEYRYTKSRTKFWKRARRSHATGAMRDYSFMRKTLAQTKDRVTDMIHGNVVKEVTRIARKYGCKD